MKKVNKILMATVAILLSLVLISTCLVSGTLAKFAIIKDATTEVSFKKFGVTMQVNRGTTVVSDNDANSVDIVYSTPIELYPGINELDAILFALDGTLNVPAILTVRVDVELSNKFLLDSSIDADENGISDLSGVSSTYKDKACMPICFKANSATKSAQEFEVTDSKDYQSQGTSLLFLNKPTVAELESDIENKLVGYIKEIISANNDVQNDDDGYYVTKSFDVNSQISNILAIGFEWKAPDGDYQNMGNTKDNNRLLSTWFANQFTGNDTPITIKVTVSLEQDIS